MCQRFDGHKTVKLYFQSETHKAASILATTTYFEQLQRYLTDKFPEKELTPS